MPHDASGGDGGLIALDGSGRIAFAMNSDGMYRGSVTEDRRWCARM
ncbi:hypothetical protein [Sphingomonas sp. T9W2]